MATYKTMGIMALILAGLIGAGVYTVDSFTGPKYFCESKPELKLVSCDRLSSTSVTCYLGTKQTTCSTKWVLVVNDLPKKEPTTETKILQYSCNQKECVVI